MNKKIKKILTASIVTLTSTAAIGCASPNSKIAQKINTGMNDFISSINKLDYVDTNQTESTLGKIVSATNSVNYFAANNSSANIEDTITKPSNRSDNFKLYVLSDMPYISLTSDDNNYELNLSMKFSTEKIENTSNDISEKINKLILKRAILMIYVNEIYSGNINLTEENRTAINAYVNVIKENASFLNGNRGMVRNQLGLASDLVSNDENNDLVNYYIIKSGEALEIRSNKIDSTISAIDSIISILEQNLTSSSCYYQNNLTNTYNNLINNLQNADTSNENNKLANSIAQSINFKNDSNSNETNNNTNNNSQNSNNNETNNINNQSTNNNTSTQNEITPTQTTNTQNRNNNYINSTNNSNNLNQNNTTNNISTNNISTNNNSTNLNNTTNNNQNRTQSVNRHRRHNNHTNRNNDTTNSISNNPTVKPEPLLDTNRHNQNNSFTNTHQNDNNTATRVPYRANQTSYLN